MMFHVKHPNDMAAPEPHAITTSDVLECLSAVNVEASPGQAELIRAHSEAVLEANKQFNLTRVTSPEDVLDLHIGDSATALPYLNQSPPGNAADLGSGAGYPGIVLSILSGRHFVLVESVKKKAAFLRQTALDLSLDIDIEAVRAEELALSRPCGFSVVIARALSSLPALVELASPLLVTGGRLICMKARPTSEELASGEAAARLCGMLLRSVIPFDLPNGGNRLVIEYERYGTVREHLPRRPGMAQRQPLG